MRSLGLFPDQVRLLPNLKSANKLPLAARGFERACDLDNAPLIEELADDLTPEPFSPRWRGGGQLEQSQ